MTTTNTSADGFGERLIESDLRHAAGVTIASPWYDGKPDQLDLALNRPSYPNTSLALRFPKRTLAMLQFHANARETTVGELLRRAVVAYLGVTDEDLPPASRPTDQEEAIYQANLRCSCGCP